jgi:RND family efflux transporter MFP subunit
MNNHERDQMFAEKYGRPGLKITGTILILLLAALIVLIPSLSDAEEEEIPVPVKTFSVSLRNIREKIRFTGTVMPAQKLNVIPATGGKLAGITVEQGDYVEKGEIIARLEMTPVRIQLSQAEAAVSVAEAGLENARTNYQRILTLKKKGTVSASRYEDARLVLKSAESKMKQAEANLEMARYNMNEAVIKAPFAGYVTARNAEEGDILSPVPGHPGVVTLMDISTVRIDGAVAAPYIRKIGKGTRALVRLENHPDTVFAGEVYSISPAAGMRTRSFPLEITVRNPGHLLKPGLFASVELIAAEREQVPAVPVDALLEEEEAAYLYVIKDGTARRREVSTGLREGIFVEITAGLREGETVILAGRKTVSDGSRVRVEGRGKS